MARNGLDVKFIDPVLDDLVNIKVDATFNRLSDSTGAHIPHRREPARGALHPHAELTQPRSVIRRLRRSKSPRYLRLGDSACVITDDDRLVEAVDLDYYG